MSFDQFDYPAWCLRRQLAFSRSHRWISCDGNKWHWMFRWDELAGSADIFYYRPNAGGIPYMLKTARPDRDLKSNLNSLRLLSVDHKTNNEMMIRTASSI